jgi:hypothetical protein
LNFASTYNRKSERNCKKQPYEKELLIISKQKTSLMAQQKIDKEFCLTDNSVNVYGYRLLTSGLILDRFNPAIGFLMHKREMGVAVRWEDFRFDGDQLFAKPVVNTTAFPDLAQQIEDGFYGAASCGNIVAIEMNDDPSIKMDGQTGPTVTKWFPRDISIVDIPGNYNALAQLYDESDKLLCDLSDNNSNNHQKQETMHEFKLTPEHAVLLDLKDDASPEQLGDVLTDLVAKAKRTDTAEQALTVANQALKDLKAETTKNDVEAILTQGMTDRILTKDLADKLRVTYAENPTGLKDLVSAMPAQTKVTTTEEKVPAKYKGKSFSDLYKSGDLEGCKNDCPDYYATLKKTK